MKNSLSIITIITLTGLSLFFGDCIKHKIKKDIVMAGVVVDYRHLPIELVSVDIHLTIKSGKETKVISISDSTAEDGSFKIPVPVSGKYVLNARKKGYGFASLVLEQSSNFDSLPYQHIYLQKLEVFEFDPKDGGTISVSGTKSLGTDASRADWGQSNTGSLPLVLDDSGRVVSFIMPESLKNAWDLQATNSVQLPSASIRIPPNGLVNSAGDKATNKVNFTFASVDMFAPDGMPGNNMAVTGRNETGTMQSFGAIVIEAYDEKYTYNLDTKNKVVAELFIPVPEWQMRLRPELPKSVPILYYDEKTGVWNERSMAYYNDSLKGYKGELYHFSAINFDLIKTEPSACLKFKILTDDFQYLDRAELTTSDANTNQLFVRSRLISSDCTGPTPDPFSPDTYTYFSLNRLIPESFAAVAFYDYSNSTPISKALYVVKTGIGYQEITDDPLGRPTCDELKDTTFGDSKLINLNIFEDIITNAIPEVLMAICEDADENYKISIASGDPAFDYHQYFISVSENPQNSGCIDRTFDLGEVSDPLFNGRVLPLIIEDQSSGEPDEFFVSVFEIAKSDFCPGAVTGSYKIEIRERSNPDPPKATLVVKAGNCML